MWRGGSFAVLYPFLRTTLILVVLVPAVTQSLPSLSRVMQTIGVAGLSLILMGLTVNDFRTGRLELSGAGSSSSNSNDYAANVILLMPAIAYLTMRRGTNIVLKILGVGALGCGCFLVLSTGSRGALISMALSTLYLLKAGSWKVRGAILVGLPVLILAAIPVRPGQAALRLTSLFSSKNDTSESVESQMQRTALLMESIRATIAHPMLGVGPGTFQEYQAQLAGENGQRGMWHETHNSYTQISSECGVPAVICYLAAIFMTYRVFGRGRKSADPRLREISTVLSLMLVSFAVCMFFLAQGYGFGFPVMGGIAISIDRFLRREQHLEAAA
jgi:O-antigen ligase